MVVAHQRGAAVGVGADDAQGFDVLKRQHAVVLEKHARLLRSLFCRGQVLRALHRVIGDAVKFAALAQYAQHIAAGEQPDGGAADVRLGDHALCVGGHDELVGTAAVDIAAILQRQGDGLLGAGGDLVVLVEVAHGPAVGHEVALKPPVLPQNLLERGAAAAGLAVGAVVGAHHRLHPGVHQRVEGGQIGLGHVLFGGPGVKFVSQRLRPGVDGEVLGAGRGLHHLAVPLEALHVGRAQLGGEEGVLAVGLVAPAPAGVAEDVHVGGPEGQPLVDVPIAVGRGGVVLGPALGGGDVAQPPGQLRVEPRRDADGLGIAGGHARPGHAVQRLVPPVVGRYAQPFDGRRVKSQLARRLVHRHLRHQRLRLRSGLISVHGMHSSYAYCQTDNRTGASTAQSRRPAPVASRHLFVTIIIPPARLCQGPGPEKARLTHE